MLCAVCLADVVVRDGVVDTHALTTPARPGGTEPEVCPMSGKPPFEWAEWSTRLAVQGRSGWRCEYCGVPAREVHHRKPRSQGGPWTPGNCLHLCSACHHYFTEHPDAAYRSGVSLHRGDDPAGVPVLAPMGTLWLTDDVAPPFPSWAR